MVAMLACIIVALTLVLGAVGVAVCVGGYASLHEEPWSDEAPYNSPLDPGAGDLGGLRGSSGGAVRGGRVDTQVVQAVYPNDGGVLGGCGCERCSDSHYDRDRRRPAESEWRVRRAYADTTWHGGNYSSTRQTAEEGLDGKQKPDTTSGYW